MEVRTDRKHTCGVRGILGGEGRRGWGACDTTEVRMERQAGPQHTCSMGLRWRRVPICKGGRPGGAKSQEVKVERQHTFTWEGQQDGGEGEEQGQLAGRTGLAGLRKRRR